MTEGLLHIPKYFDIGILGGYGLVVVLEDYLKLGGEICRAEKILDNPPAKMDDHEVSKLEDILADFKSSKIQSYLVGKLQAASKDDDKKQYARKLMKAGRVEGLVFCRSWVQRRKSFDDFISAATFKTVPTQDALPEMFQMAAVLMQPGFLREPLHGQDQDLLFAINERAMESETNYYMVRAQYLPWIDEYKPNSFIRYYLNALENRYYASLAETRSLAASVKLVDVIAEIK